MANTAATWQYVVVTGSTWRLLPRKISPFYCRVSYVAVTRIPLLVLRNTWHYVIIRYSYGELPKFVVRCSYEAALGKGVTTALAISRGIHSLIQWKSHHEVIQPDHGYPATGPAPVRISDLSGYESNAQTQQV